MRGTPFGRYGHAVTEAAIPAHAPLRVRAYRRIWLAAVVSHLGTFLQLTAGPWLMQELTGSPLMVASVTTALLLPRLFLTLPAGALADVVDRRTLLIVAHVTSATPVAIMAVLAWSDRLTPTGLLLLTLFIGMGNAVGMPSFQTLVPDLVPRPLLAQAITLNSAAFNVARAVGPSIGGALVAIGLTHVAFGANAVSYLAVIGVLLTFGRFPPEEAGRRHLWRSAATGLRYARFTPSIRTLLVVTALFSITAASVQALLPSLASEALGLSAAGFGVLYALFGSGALVGAMTRERVRVVAKDAMLPGTIVVFGLAGIVAGMSASPVVSGAALAVTGLTWVWTMTTLNASVQTLAPRWVRGRIVSIYVLAIGLQPVGAFFSGVIAEIAGVSVAIASMTGATALLGVVAFRVRIPVLGELSEPAPVPDDWVVPTHARAVGGSPIVVTTTWQIDPDRIEAFLEVMRSLRRQRLRTGATRWALFRDAERSHVITEMFSVPDWDEHLAQHGRIDAVAAKVIRRARAFDVRGEPRSRHLAGLDIADRHAAPIHEQLVTVHAELHRTDGSVPLTPDEPDEPDEPDGVEGATSTGSARGEVVQQ